MANFCERTSDGRDICRWPFDYFYFLTDPDDPATRGHQECWVGMSTDDTFGDLDGEGCDVGCRSCPDLPSELLHSAAQLEGSRWLHPHPQRLSIDATGLRRPLRASQVMLIPRFETHYVRGVCYDNAGTECFGGSVCECFGERSGEKNVNSTVGAGGCFAAPTGNVTFTRGYFADEFFYRGISYPPRDAEDYDMFCRRFEPQGTDENFLVTLAGGEMYSPAFVRSSYRFDKPVTCIINMMIPCVGGVPDSSCDDAFRNTPRYDEFNVLRPEPDWYNEAANRTQFGHIRLGGDPHFRSIDNRFDGLRERDFAHLKAKNEVIRSVFSIEFPTANGTLNFEQVDHEQTGDRLYYSGMNLWTRSWDAAREEGVDIQGLPVVTSFPIVAHLVNLDEDVPADLVITSVESRLWLLPMQVQTQYSWPTEYFLEYHVRYILKVKLAVRYNRDSQSSLLQQPWLPAEDPLREVEVTVDYGNRIEQPVIAPRGYDRIVIHDRDGTPVDVPTHVEWMGYLGAVGKERAPRKPVARGTACWAILDQVRGMEVPGWPFAHGMMKDAPQAKQDMAQIHGGTVTLDFV